MVQSCLFPLQWVRAYDLGGVGQKKSKELNAGGGFFFFNYCKDFQLSTFTYGETSLEKSSNASAQQACPDNTLTGK